MAAGDGVAVCTGTGVELTTGVAVATGVGMTDLSLQAVKVAAIQAPASSKQILFRRIFISIPP